MISPPPLKTGDKIAIIATARKISPPEMQPAISILESWGLKVVLGKNLYKKEFQFAGTEAERLKDLQNALNDKSIKAILFARGGYGTTQLVGDIIFSDFTNNPKWLIGFSDITALHLEANVLNIETVHAPMALNFATTPAKTVNQLKRILFGEQLSYVVKKSKLNRPGTAKGVLIGGNLSMIYASMGTLSYSNFFNKILFIEDLDEYLYHLDRMMVSLDLAAVLMNISGLIVGGMNNMRDNTKKFGFKTNNPFGKTAHEIILERVRRYNFPVCFDFPAGHIKNNNPLILGREVELKVGKEVSLNFGTPN